MSEETAAAAERETREAVKAERCAAARCPLAGMGDARCAKCTGPIAWTASDGKLHSAAKHAARRSCHNCPMDGLGLPVCWAGCIGPVVEFQTDGQSMVTLGGMTDAGAYVGARMAYDAKLARLPSADRVTRLGAEAERAVMTLVRLFVELEASQVMNLHAMLRAKTMTGAARLRGVSKQAVHASARRMAKAHPELAAFFNWTGEP